MHWLDRASGAALARTAPRRRVFRDGWGDRGVLAWYASIVRQPPDPPAADPEIEMEHRSGGLKSTDLVFESPAEHLPAASRTARARMIAPEAGADRVCLLMAAWNEHGYAARSKLAALLARDGIATVMLENPLYGSRRTDPEDGLPLATVSDFAVMGRAAVVEGIALLAHLRDRFPTTGVGGYSMGGNIAAFVGTMAGFPTALAPIAAPHSPGPPFIHGVIRRGIAWEALDDDPGEARKRLSEFMWSASVLDHEPPDHTRAAVLVAGTVDGFVPTSAVQAVHRHWPGSKLEWVSAGHATLLWRNRDRMADATVQAFDRFEALGS